MATSLYSLSIRQPPGSVETDVRRKRVKAPKSAKPRFIVDNDASGTAGVLTKLGWHTYAADPFASDTEIADRALQSGLSVLTMDNHFSRLSLQSIPFTVILSGGAQQSMSTATAQIQYLHQLIRVGEIDPGPHQRVTLTTGVATIQTIGRDGSPITRRLSAKGRSRRKMK